MERPASAHCFSPLACARRLASPACTTTSTVACARARQTTTASSLPSAGAVAGPPARVARAGSGNLQRLEALTERLQYLQQRVREVEREIDEWLHGPLMDISLEVKLAARQGQDLMAEMAAKVEKDLERKQAELDFLRAQLTQLGIECE